MLLKIADTVPLIRGKTRVNIQLCTLLLSVLIHKFSFLSLYFKFVIQLRTNGVYSRTPIKRHLLSGHLLSGQLLKSRNYFQLNTINKSPIKQPPLLSDQLLKSRNYFQLNTINKTPFKRSPLLSDRGHLLVVPMKVFYCFLPLLSGHPKLSFVFDRAMTDKNPK